MKKLLILLILAGILGGLFYAFLYVNDIPLNELRLSDITLQNVENIKNIHNLSGAGLAAKRALDLWDRGEYDRLYRGFTKDVQHVLPQEAFLKSKNPILIGGVLKPQIEEVKEEGTMATVQASVVNLDIKALTAEIMVTDPAQRPTLERQKILVELKQEDGAWKINQFEPITWGLRKLDEERKKKRRDVEASRDAEVYMPNIVVEAVRARVIHLYGQEPFVVGVVKNSGNRDVLKLGIRFSIVTPSGGVVEDTYHPVVESSINEEEKPLRPGEERKFTYQLDRQIPGLDYTDKVTARIVELRVGPEYQSETPENAKDKLKKAKHGAGGGDVVDVSKTPAAPPSSS
ncbi:MAG: hypothetical protein U0166_24610 [Acidobacteriota bacterium]